MCLGKKNLLQCSLLDLELSQSINNMKWSGFFLKKSLQLLLVQIQSYCNQSAHMKLRTSLTWFLPLEIETFAILWSENWCSLWRNTKHPHEHVVFSAIGIETKVGSHVQSQRNLKVLQIQQQTKVKVNTIHASSTWRQSASGFNFFAVCTISVYTISAATCSPGDRGMDQIMARENK